jgi:hypothetical protein
VPIEVACQCGKRFAARDALAGKTVACPACSAAITIPTPNPAAAGVAGILDEIGLQANAAGLVCPKCHTQIYSGTVCPKCRWNVQTASYAQTAARQQSAGHGYDWSRIKKVEANLTGSVVDQELTWLEIAICTLFGGVGMIWGLILFLRGHSKGLVMIVLSMILPLTLAIVYLGYLAMMKTVLGGDQGGTKKTSHIEMRVDEKRRIPRPFDIPADSATRSL